MYKYFLKVKGKIWISIALLQRALKQFCFVLITWKKSKASDKNVLVPVQQAHAAELLFKGMKT